VDRAKASEWLSPSLRITITLFPLSPPTAYLPFLAHTPWNKQIPFPFMSLSDFSDLTELSSSESEVPLSRTSRKPAGKSKSDYRLKNILRPPRTSQYALSTLYGTSFSNWLLFFSLSFNDKKNPYLDRMVENSIDLDPEYQRDVVWYAILTMSLS